MGNFLKGILGLLGIVVLLMAVGCVWFVTHCTDLGCS